MTVIDADLAHGPDDRRLEPNFRRAPAPGSPEDTPKDHLQRVLARAEQVVSGKYQGGQVEHGGTLSRKPVLGELIHELADGLVYALTLEEQAGQMAALLQKAILERDWLLVQRAINLLATGNAEGQRP